MGQEIKNPPQGLTVTDSGRTVEEHTMNLDTIRTFFKLLTYLYDKNALKDKTFCGYWLDDTNSQPLAGFGVVYRTLNALIGEYARFAITPKPTFHITLNEMNHKGRRNENVEHVRCLCVDLDRVVPQEELLAIRDTYKPAFIVESSPQKYHLYWQVPIALDIKSWSNYQKGLSILFNADPSLSTPSKTIRVPGFPRITKQGELFVPRIIYIADGIETKEPLSKEELHTLFPTALELATQTKKEEKSVNKKLLAAINTFGDIMDVDISLGELINEEELERIIHVHYQNAHAGGRNAFLYRFLCDYLYQCVTRGTLDDFDTIPASFCTLAAQLNNKFPEGPLPSNELEKTLNSAFQHAINAHQKKKKREEENSARIKKSFQGIEKAMSILPNTTPDTSISTPPKITPQEAPNISGVVEFEYDYSQPLLRHDRWSKLSIAGRVLQKFEGHIVRASKTVYAFDLSAKVWRPQKTSKELLNAYTVECVGDLLSNPDFIREECRNEKTGELSVAKFNNFKKNYLSPNTIKDVVTYVENADVLPRRELSTFDTNDHLLYCANGVLDMLRGELRDACAEDYLLQRTEVPYVADATCYDWIAFLREIYAHNENSEDIIQFVQRVFGYSLSGGIQAQKLFVHYGEACNGKSKVLAALKMLGGSYTAKLDGNNITSTGKQFQKEFERIGAKIEGKRICIIDDLDSETEWSEGHVKSLTDYSIVARRLYEEEKDIANHCTFHIACNQAPKPTSDNAAVMRRMCIIPYPRKFAQDAQKEQWIMEMIKREAPGILKWAVEGYQKYVNTGGLGYPDEIIDTLDTYKEEHLTCDESIKAAILEIGTPLDEDNGTIEDWHGVYEITKAVNEALKPKGKRTTHLVISRLMTEMGALRARKRFGKIQKKCFHLKFIKF